MSYIVKEVFPTVQGEGFFAGVAAVFLRFAGCNAWSGRSQDRERDAKKAVCAAWCDTDFSAAGAKKYEHAADLAAHVAATAPKDCRIVVVTGGEPSLQLDDVLVKELHAHGLDVHVETNGSNPLPSGLQWVTLSPKPPLPVVLTFADEVKVVFPAVDPLEWEDFPANFRYVQPQDPTNTTAASVHLALWRENQMRAAEFVMKHPAWRLGVQMHKVVGLR